MSQISITLPDGSVRSVPSGTPVRDFASSALPLGVVKKAIAAYVDDRLVDLTFPLEADATLLQQVAEALRRDLAPAGAQIESVEGKLLVRGVNIRVSVRNSVVTLEGAPEKSDVIARAEKIARSFRSVQRVDNRMVAAGLLDFD